MRIILLLIVFVFLSEVRSFANFSGKNYSHDPGKTISLLLNHPGIQLFTNPEDIPGRDTITNQSGESYIAASPGSLSLSDMSGSVSISVNSDMEWSASKDCDWLTFNKEDSTTLIVSFEENPSIESRSAIIKVLGDVSAFQVLTFKQPGTTTASKDSTFSLSLSQSGGSRTFTVISDFEWTAKEKVEWLRYSKKDATTLAISYDENPGDDSRFASLLLRGYFALSIKVIIEQAGAAPKLNVLTSSDVVDPASGTYTFDVSSNIDWSVSESCDWLTVTKIDSATLTVSYDENASVEARSTDIILSGPGVESQIIAFEQSGVVPVLEASRSTVTVSALGDTTILSITSNIDWSVSESCDWLTASKAGSDSLILEYDENMGTDSRQAEISLSGDGVSYVPLTLIQEGAEISGIDGLFSNSTITSYPNPASDKVFLRSNSDVCGEIVISVFNNTGKLLYSDVKDGLSADELIEIDISSFASGSYIMKLQNSRSVLVRRVIKE